MCSTKPAIGSCFLTPEMVSYLRGNNCVPQRGAISVVPRFYVTKVLDDFGLRVRRLKIDALSRSAKFTATEIKSIEASIKYGGESIVSAQARMLTDKFKKRYGKSI